MEFLGGTKMAPSNTLIYHRKKKINPAGGALGNIFNRQKFRLGDVFTPLTLLCLRPFIHAEVKVQKPIMCLLGFFMLQRFFTKVDVYKLSMFYYFFLISRKKLP